ncbi:MAG: VOC family protein [Bacteroidota bacterium]
MKNSQINYVEFKAKDLEQTKQFYQKIFGWTFTDYGPTYIAFDNSGLEGGFEQADNPVVNGALVVLYHENLSHIQQQIEDAGGKISKPIFSFPGGSRFHFKDPSGNELAVWSDK